MTKALNMTTDLPSPYLIADHPGVELLNSAGAPYGAWIDWLQNGQEMLGWMAAVGLLSTDQARTLAVQMPRRELDETAQAMRALRDAFRANLPEASSSFVAQLNQILSKGRGHYHLRSDDQGLALDMVPRLKTGGDLLGLCAAAIADLYCLGEPGRTRQCDGPTCTYWFRDVSKNNRRRWCSMAVCGNRAKAATHRAKQKRD